MWKIKPRLNPARRRQAKETGWYTFWWLFICASVSSCTWSWNYQKTFQEHKWLSFLFYISLSQVLYYYNQSTHMTRRASTQWWAHEVARRKRKKTLGLKDKDTVNLITPLMKFPLSHFSFQPLSQWVNGLQLSGDTWKQMEALSKVWDVVMSRCKRFFWKPSSLSQLWPEYSLTSTSWKVPCRLQNLPRFGQTRSASCILNTEYDGQFHKS